MKKAPRRCLGVCRDSRISIHDEWTIRYANLRYFSEKDYFLIEISLIILQGLPAATTLSGIHLVTTEPAPIVTLLPIVTPGRIVTLPPIHTLSPILTGSAHSWRVFLSIGSVLWQAVYMLTLGPMKQSSPIVTGASSRIVRLKFAKNRSPMLICFP